MHGALGTKSLNVEVKDVKYVETERTCGHLPKLNT